MNCRFCKSELKHSVVNLGMSPLANSFLKPDMLHQMEPFFPLQVFVCKECLLVQLADVAINSKNIFSNYAYFSSYSTTWLKHIENFVNDTINKFNIDKNSQIIEIASNDGYLLQYFKKKEIPVLGIEPASNIAIVAEDKGIPTINKFFGIDTANELIKSEKQADLLIAVNVLPHVPNLEDFVGGLSKLLKPQGILVIQFSTYMLPFLQNTYFDSIYHEHFSYFSLMSVQKILSKFGLQIFDIEELDIHGGSLRIFSKHDNNEGLMINQSVKNLIKKEIDFGLNNALTYEKFSNQVTILKQKIWQFFIKAKNDGKTIVCYGAPAKGNTLLNFCGIGTDFIEYTVDISPFKQGLYLPGTHIPILEPDKIRQTKPDYIVILAWNLKDEIMKQLDDIKEWGGKFVVLIPEVKIF